METVQTTDFISQLKSHFPTNLGFSEISLGSSLATYQAVDVSGVERFLDIVDEIAQDNYLITRRTTKDTNLVKISVVNYALLK